MTQTLIMIMGVQRSGTSCLFESLSHDPNLRAYPEALESEIYQAYDLKPEPAIRKILLDCESPCLLKPVNETKKRSLISVLEEFDAYPVQVLWLYRDPVDVIFSMLKKWHSEQPIQKVPESLLYEFASGWRQRNQYVLEAWHKHPNKVEILSYHDFLASADVFEGVCQKLHIKGKNLFKPHPSPSRDQMTESMIGVIEMETKGAFAKLEQARATYSASV